MSERFEVAENERGIIRLFSVDLPPEQISAFAEKPLGEENDDTPWPLKEALGAQYLDLDFIELFPITNLTGLGLPGYMVEGLGIAEEDIAEDHARLSSLKGHILIVVSSAFGGFAQTLSPRAPLRWIGTYTEETAPVQFQPLPSETARGNVNTDTKPRPSNAAMSGRVAMAALLVLALLVVVLVWIAG
ncbi:hypothetical protein AAFO92_07340 [Roseovarius sp. CAU 1744]|uniref:hypothetical protein n=1 Tax=Roseovarius sp. CAU 1744 TaxID=3140368 RepID=UPI00325C007E